MCVRLIYSYVRMTKTESETILDRFALGFIFRRHRLIMMALYIKVDILKQCLKK